MNEPKHIARDQTKRSKRLSQQFQQQPPRDARRKVAATESMKSDRPRSGSWGAQELHYYMDNATTTASTTTTTTTVIVDNNNENNENNTLKQQNTRPKSRFLSKLKMQRSTTTTPTTLPDHLTMATSITNNTLSGSSSVMTLTSANNTNNNNNNNNNNNVNGHIVPPSSESFMVPSHSGNNNNNSCNIQQKRRPPLPLEMIHPEHQTTGVRSTPHPSLSRYEEKSFSSVVNNNNNNPHSMEPSLFAMTPTNHQQKSSPVPVPSPSKNNIHQHHVNNTHNKKRTTAIRSIGRFFRALGKNQSIDPSTKESPNYVDKQLLLDQRYHSPPSTIPITEPRSSIVRRSRSIDTIPAIPEEEADETIQATHGGQLAHKYSTLNCIEPKQHQRQALRRSLSLDGIQRGRDNDIIDNTTPDTTTTTTTTTPSESHHTVRRKKPLATSSPNHNYRRRGRRKRTNTACTSTTTTDDDEYEDDDYTMILSSDTEVDPCAAQESRIAGDRLSKRLSGGHFGSAGGLILSTLPVISRPQTDDEYEEREEEIRDNGISEGERKASTPSSDHGEVEETTLPFSIDELGSLQHQRNVASTVHTETSESDTIVTPPNQEHHHSPVIIKEQKQRVERHDSIAPVDDSYDEPNLEDVDQEENNNNEEDDQDEFDQLAYDTAKKIWEQDPTVYSNIEHIAEWIGNGKPLSMSILQHYFLYFDFTNMRLDDAFRKLCGKLHLKAETQQIDRILVEFANRYWDCNPSCIFGNSDVVHAVVYSILLLNTDLHVAQGDHKKMSRSAFVRNTMNAARAQYDRNATTLNSQEDDILIREEHRNSNVTFQSFDSRTQSHDLKRTNSCKSSTSSMTGGTGSGGGLGRFYTAAASSLDMTPAAVVHGNHPMGTKGWQSEVEAILREMYVSVRNRQIRHPSSKDDLAREEANMRHSRRRSLQVTGSRVGAFKRSVGTIMWKAARESMFVSEHAELDRFYGTSPSSTSTTTTNGITSQSPRSTTSVHSTSFPRRRSMTSLKSSFSQNSHLTQNSNSITAYQSVAPLLHHSELPTSYTSAAPYYKEGLLVRKHLLERAGQKAKHRDWKECFLVVDRGEIRMYKLDSGPSDQRSKTMARSSIMISRVNLADALLNNPAVGGGDWLANAETVGEIDLKHTLSNALPSGYSRQRPHAFALQQPNGGVFLFQVGSAEQVVEWVSTCNYWAARESKEPLMGGVSNMEYGWGSCLDCISSSDDDENSAVSWQQNLFPPVTINEWQPPVPPSVGSAMEEVAQLDILHKHVTKLNDELDKHRDIKCKMELRFSARSTPGSRAMANWENKSQYLLHEIIKYQNYCDAIEKSLALQAKAVEEERKNKKEEDDNDNNNNNNNNNSLLEQLHESVAEEEVVH